jgi:hypothetical protein
MLLVRAGRAGLRRSLPVLGGVAIAWSASFLLSYTATSRNISTVSSSIFGTSSDHSSSKLRQVGDAAWTTIEDPAGFLASTRSIAAFCLVIGFVTLLLDRRREPVALLGVIAALTLAAAFLDRYPLSGRFSLFLVAFMLIVIARGTADVIAASRRSWLVGVPLLLFLAVPVAGRALMKVPHPPKREDVRPLLEHLVREWKPGDTLYVYRTTQYALRYYAECSDCDRPRLPFRVEPAPKSALNGDLQAALVSRGPVVVGTESASLGDELKQLDVLRGRGRTWLLFSHVEHDQESAFTGYVETFDRRVEAQGHDAAALYLFEPAKA